MGWLGSIGYVRRRIFVDVEVVRWVGWCTACWYIWRWRRLVWQVIGVFIDVEVVCRVGWHCP